MSASALAAWAADNGASLRTAALTPTPTRKVMITVTTQDKQTWKSAFIDSDDPGERARRENAVAQALLDVLEHKYPTPNTYGGKSIERAPA